MRQAVSTRSGSQPSARPISRPTWATSSECVSRVRTKSSLPGPSTCVFAPRRRSPEECTTRARSRSNAVRCFDLGGSGYQRSVSASVYDPSHSSGTPGCAAGPITSASKAPCSNVCTSEA